MLTSLSFIFLVGLAMAAICQRIRLPRIIGMLLTGIVLGPYVLDLLDPSILSISSELRQMALIIILVKAGLSLNLADLKKVGRPAVMLSCVPASFELLGYVLFAPMILGVNRIEAAVLGAVLAAVSPAVVVPRMVKLMETGYGTKKSIPQMILAGASCDDIFVIVLFSTFSGMAQGGSARVMDFVNIPISIVSGILLGAVAGWLLSLFFETAYAKKHYVRNSMKVIIALGVSFLLMSVETWVKPYISVSGLLAVVSMACVLKLRSIKAVRAGGCSGGYPLYNGSWPGSSSYDLYCVNFPYDWCADLPGRNSAELERAAVLRHCLSAKGNRAGSHWFGTDGYGTSVRSDCAFRGSYGHSDHGSAGGTWDGQYV